MNQRSLKDWQDAGYDIGPDGKTFVKRDPSAAPARQDEKPVTIRPAINLPKPAKMSQAEREYRVVLSEEFKTFTITHGLRFPLASGCLYTPDWIVWDGSTILLACEVKGTRRLESSGRSHLAFKTVLVEWPHIRWRFAKKNDDGTWAIAEVKKNDALCDGGPQSIESK